MSTQVPITDISFELKDISISKKWGKTETRAKVTVWGVHDGEKAVNFGTREMQVGDRINAPISNVVMKIEGTLTKEG